MLGATARDKLERRESREIGKGKDRERKDLKKH